METKNSWILGWLLALALVVTGLVGCGDGYEIIDEGYDVRGVGIVSDTTAMVAIRHWEQFEDDCCYPGGRSDGYDYKGWGLKLVDVRYEKVYWEAEIDDNGAFSADQLSDSIMCVWTNDAIWLWTLGQKKPRRIDLIGNARELDFNRVRTWRGDSIIMFFDNERYVLDTLVGSFRVWAPSTSMAWVDSCDDIRWRSEGGLCLNADVTSNCNLNVLQNGIDTLSSFSFTNQQDCPYLHFSFSGKYILAWQSNALTSFKAPTDDAIISVLNWSNDSSDGKPLFWMTMWKSEFVDSLGNVTRY